MATNVIQDDLLRLGFDGKTFFKGIDKSLDKVNQLQSSIDFNGSIREFERLGRRANKVSFADLMSNVDNIRSRVSLLGVAFGTMVQEFTKKAMSGVGRVFEVGVMTPLRTGMQEYETQIGAIQTILANTSSKGTVLEDVQLALDELNRYADLTIYNFTEMTRNIGTFTAAGVDLDVSVDAIKGIANLAAVSGSTSQQASTAMYQLSQALATGTVKLMDWNSVVNAGMGGEVFKEALMDTARHHDVAIDSIIERNGSFRDSLHEGWLTSTILLETLQKFTGDLTDEQLLQMGYTQDQIVEIQKMAQTANDAATKIKTLSQLKDTVAEAMQSGWAVTWRTIFGDFEEAKEVFGDIGTVLGGMVEESSSARNELLSGWKALGGRTVLLRTVFSVLQIGINLSKTFREAWSTIFPPVTATQLVQIGTIIQNIANRIQVLTTDSSELKTVVMAVASVWDIFRMFLVAVFEPLLTYSGLVKEGSSNLLEFILNVSNFVIELRNSIKETDFFSRALVSLGEFLIIALGYVEDFGAELMKLDIIRDIVNYFKSLTGADILNGINNISVGILEFGQYVLGLWETVQGSEEFETVMRFISGLSWENLKTITNDSYAAIPGVISGITNSILGFRDSVIQTVQTIIQSDTIQGFLEWFNNFDPAPTSDAIGGIFEFFKSLPGLASQLLISLSEFLPSIDVVAGGLDKFFSGIVSYITDNDVSFVGILNAINSVLGTAILVSLTHLLSGSWAAVFMNRIFGSKSTLRSAIMDSFDAITETMVSMQNNIRADALMKIAIAIGVIVASILLLSLVDSARLIQAVAAIGILASGLLGMSLALTKINFIGLIKGVGVILALSSSLLIMAVAVRLLASLEPNEMARGIIGIGVAMLVLVASLKLMSSTTLSTAKTAFVLIGLSAGLVVLSLAIRMFSSIPMDEMVRGLIGIGAALLIFGTFSRLVDGPGLISGALGVGVMALALVGISEAVRRLGNIDLDKMVNGLIGFGVALAGIALFSKVVNPAELVASSAGMVIAAVGLMAIAQAILTISSVSSEGLLRALVGLAGGLIMMSVAAKAMQTSLPGAAAIVVMAGGLFVLATTMKILGSLSWEQILKSLVMLAGMLVIIGVAGIILTPVAPILLAIGLAMLTVGIAALAIGYGIAAAALALATLAASGALIATAITLIGGAIIGLLPALATAIATAITNFITVLWESGPLLFEAAIGLFLMILEAIITVTPNIILTIVKMINALLNALVEYGPAFMEKAWFLLLMFIKGISDNIEEIVVLGSSIVVGFLKGITKMLPELTTAAFEFILAFMDSMKLGIDLYMPQIIEKSTEIGAAITDAIKESIIDGAKGVIAEIQALGQAVIDTLADVWQAQSPAKAFGDLTDWAVIAMINQFQSGQKGVVASVKAIASSVVDNLSDTMAEIESDGFRPRIRPVYDFSTPELGTTSFDVTAFRTAETTRRDITTFDDERRRDNGRGDDDGRGWSLTYNVVSPKTIDASTLYRKSKSAMAELEQQRKEE